MEQYIREYLMAQPEIERVEFRYDSEYMHKGKLTLFEWCHIIIRKKPTYVFTKNVGETLDSMFNLRLGKSDTKWRVTTF